MKKLQSITKDGTETFDETLRKLFEKKMRCEMAIYQVSHHNRTQVLHVEKRYLTQEMDTKSVDILCSDVHCII